MPSNPMPPQWLKRATAKATVEAYDETMAQSVVLTYVLTECPKGVTLVDLSARLNGQLYHPEDGMAVERAVRELVRARLLHIDDGRIVATHAEFDFG